MALNTIGNTAMIPRNSAPDHCDLADDLADIGRGRFARTDARNRTVVVFDVICNLNRVVLHRNIEVVEPDNQNEIENAVEPVGRRQP